MIAYFIFILYNLAAYQLTQGKLDAQRKGYLARFRNQILSYGVIGKSPTRYNSSKPGLGYRIMLTAL
jgi:hypothetical protein